MSQDRAYERVISNIEEWPIYKLTANKEAFAKLFIEKSLEQIHKVHTDERQLEDELLKAIYLENIRLKENPWKVDTKDEKIFWSKLKNNLTNRAQIQLENRDGSVYKKIVSQYANEIIGNFNKKTYDFAEIALAQAFNKLLNPTKITGNYDAQNQASKRIHLMGEVEAIRKLATKGTVLLLPTHHSNLDSILIGWALNYIGLPAFLYGAGLNLFNNPIMGYYMNRLGAYKIDRRKKNSFYLETLKTYSKLTIQSGCHTLFFPGGTRSRSGKLESRLKLGLMSTIVDAQQLNFTNPINKETTGQKIFIVPLVISYHFVLEAAQLIDQHLKITGKEKYFTGNDSIPSSAKIANFLRKFFTSKSDVALNFGKPMDILGNRVDENTGISFDRNDNPIDVKDYFMSNGTLTQDDQRTSEYTRMLASKISERFMSDNVVLTSHLCAYTAFEILKKRHRRLDLYGLMRLPKEDRIIPYEHFMKVIEKVKDEMMELHNNGKVVLSPYIIDNNLEKFVDFGLTSGGIYHSRKPIFRTKTGDISSEDMKLLYFYHNRMVGYGISNLF